MNGEVTFLTIYSMAAGLYHIGEWFCFHDLAKIQTKYGVQIDTPGKLWHYVVEKEVPKAGFIRDLNNAAKHAKLTVNSNPSRRGNPSTNMYYAANTFITSTGFGEGRFGQGNFGGTSEAKMDESGQEIALEPIATEVFDFWEKLVDEFYPVPVTTVSVEQTHPSANS